MVNLARTGFASHQNPRRKEFQNEQLKQSGESPTASALVSLQKLECGLTAVETKLGWTVFGKGSCRIDNILPSLSMHSMSLPANKLWELEVLGIASENEKEKDDFNLKDFNDKIKILPNGRYEVELPWKLDSSNLPNACKGEYAACVFIRSEVGNESKVTLIRAKNRVAPLKSLSIPRLELMACCIGARLVNSVIRALGVASIKVTLWSDSTVALWWIKECGEWSVFVANRVKEIKELTGCFSWRHVPGNMNIADLLSRGCTPKQMLNSKWWKGPIWLKENPESWPVSEVNSQPSEVDIERRKCKIVNMNLTEDTPLGDDNKKRLFWPLAKIIELIPGRDGKIRTVKLKTQHGTVLRPIQRIYPLEIYSKESVGGELGGEESNSNNVTDNENNVTSADDVIVRKFTSCGRPVKAPSRLDLLNNVCYTLETLSESQGGGEDVAKRSEITAAAWLCCDVSLRADSHSRM
ncbi:uncharacterized protein NPIL_72611 [Nephila pilipes]|uniref:DUF5641 domain-containing protein n=1 Tax=Nephila pilipes TaxID=299642 RepID=A0A8X6N705_NEPPI|nr:uncharacterized protein NPIL_72611 [Nephila pilipes]